MDDVKKYILLCDVTHKGLTGKVNTAIENGYLIHGNHTVTSINPEAMIVEYCVSVTK